MRVDTRRKELKLAALPERGLWWDSGRALLFLYMGMFHFDYKNSTRDKMESLEQQPMPTTLKNGP